MPVNETTRLRIRQYLIDLMDEEAADAILESMPPVPWTQLATKDDLAVLEGRIDGRIDSLNGRIDGLSGRVDSLSGRIDSLSDRIDSLGVRIDDMAASFGALARAATIGAAAMSLTLVVFMIGTITSLIVSGAIG